MPFPAVAGSGPSFPHPLLSERARLRSFISFAVQQLVSAQNSHSVRLLIDADGPK